MGSELSVVVLTSIAAVVVSVSEDFTVSLD